MKSVTKESTTTSETYPTRERIEDFLSERRVMAALTVLPATTLFVLIVGGPIVWAFIAAFYEIPALSPEWEWAGLANFQEILAADLFWSSLSRNLVFAAGTAFLNTTVGVGIALLLNREFRFKRFVFPVALLPYLVPTVILGYITLWMANSSWGIINQILLFAGIISQDNLVTWFTGNGDIAMLSVILTHNWKYSIFVAIMVVARLESIPSDLYEAARMAGASKYQQFRDITLPNIKSVLFIVLLLRGVWNFNKFDIIWVLTRGGPGDATTTLPIYAYEQAFRFNNLGVASALSVVLFVVLSIVAIIYFRVAQPSKEVRVE